jgi:3-dehydroquinate synthase
VPTFGVKTAHHSYPVVVERGALARLHEFIPSKAGKIFLTTNKDIWALHRTSLTAAFRGRDFVPLFFPGGEEQKRFSSVEKLAEEMIRAGGDRSSVVVAFGGGIVNDMGGFLAAIFMRGIPVIQIPTTLLAQVDAAVGGKTGVNLVAGKNLIGSFHPPFAVIVDPNLLRTLPVREYRAGLFEVVKHGIIASPELFQVMTDRAADVIGQTDDVVDHMISESVRIKSEVVSTDEKEGDLRRILNFGHTFGHALESETKYSRFLHGEAVAWGMNAATHLSRDLGLLTSDDACAILRTIALYGPIPPLNGISAENLEARLVADKKSIQGKVHFVLADRIGHVVVRSDVPSEAALQAIRAALQ